MDGCCFFRLFIPGRNIFAKFYIEAQKLIVKFVKELEGYMPPPVRAESTTTYSTQVSSMGAIAQSAVSTLSRKLMDVVLPGEEERALFSGSAPPINHTTISDVPHSNAQSSANDTLPKSSLAKPSSSTKLRLSKKTHQ